MSKFELSGEVDNNKIFLINLSALENRIDCEYYKENLDFSNCIKLKEYVKVKGGKRLPKEHIYSNDETEYLYLRVSNFSNDNDEIDFNDFKFINKDTFRILERYEVMENDLIFSIAGTVGKLKLISNIPNNKRIILTENAAKIEIINNEILPKYLEIILKTNFLQKQINLNYIQTTIPKIGLDRIENLYIPKIPSKEIQESIIKIYEIYFEKKQQKEQEAKELLESIDSYLLDELGITLPEVDNGLEKRIFEINFSEIGGNRFDSEAYFPFFKKLQNAIRKSKYKEVSLKNIIYKIERRFRPIENEEYSYIQLGSIGRDSSEVLKPLMIKLPEIPSRAQQVVKSGEILFSIANPQWGTHIIVNECNDNFVASSGFIILNSNENNQFIVEVLRSSIYKKLYEKYLTGSGLFLNISTKDLLSFEIPLPPIEKQNEIAEHIQAIRDKAKQLQNEAKDALGEAKNEVEKLILGGY